MATEPRGRRQAGRSRRGLGASPRPARPVAFRVVGVGASAGGLEAFSKLVAGIGLAEIIDLLRGHTAHDFARLQLFRPRGRPSGCESHRLPEYQGISWQSRRFRPPCRGGVSAGAKIPHRSDRAVRLRERRPPRLDLTVLSLPAAGDCGDDLGQGLS